MTPPKVKICCIGSVEEARLAVACGASALGPVSAMPSGSGVIDEDFVAETIGTVPRAVVEMELIRLGRALPGVSLVQVIHVTVRKSIDVACAVASFVDAIPLDSGNQKINVKQLGGTGRVHDWRISRAIRERCGKPVFLAGGLKADNVCEVIDQVQPFGLDLTSGVRTGSALDESKLCQFFAAHRQ